MRAKYWETEDTPSTQITIGKLPAIFTEWSQMSFRAVAENDAGDLSQMTEAGEEGKQEPDAARPNR